jgi:hypothetical protein
MTVSRSNLGSRLVACGVVEASRAGRSRVGSEETGAAKGETVRMSIRMERLATQGWRTGRASRRCAALGGLSVIVSACQCPQVVVPQNDLSPPTRVDLLGAIGNRNDTATVTTPVDWQVNAGDQIAFTLTAQDIDGGVRSISVQGELDVTCVSPNGVATKLSSLVRGPNANQPGAVGSSVCQTLSVGSNVRLADYVDKCAGTQPGSVTVSLDGSLRGHAENFSGGAANSQWFSFHWKKP